MRHDGMKILDLGAALCRKSHTVAKLTQIVAKMTQKAAFWTWDEISLFRLNS
jgi:hypothetical protein